MAVADSKLVVRSNDDIIVCVGTPTRHSIQSDNAELLAEVKNHIKKRTPVPIIAGKPSLLFVADEDSYTGLVAAMFAPAPGRSFLLVAPERVLYEIRRFNSDGIGFIL